MATPVEAQARLRHPQAKRLSERVRSRRKLFEGLTLPAVGSLTAALLFTFAQLHPGACWLAPIVLVPWLSTIRHASVTRSAASGFAFGAGSGALCAGWIPAGLEALGATPLHAVAGWLFVALWGAGLPWAVVGLALGALRAQGTLRAGAGATFVVFLVDLARSYAPGGLPWLLLGHTQAGIPGVAQLAVLGGVPLLSALVFAMNLGLAALVGRARLHSGRCLSLLAFLLGAYGAVVLGGEATARWARGLATSFPRDAVRLLLVQPNLPTADRWASAVQRTNLALVARQTQAALDGAMAPDLVVWPETVLTDPIDANPTLGSALQDWVDRLGLPVVLGVARSAASAEPGRYRNSVLWMEPTHGLLASFDKTRPLPVVEGGGAFPGRGELAWLLGVAGRRERMEAADENHPLQGREELAVAICFEALFPGLVAARRTPQTLALLNLANDSWFAGPLPSRQQVTYASFRAIEQRLWTLRVAHGGISAVIDPYGHVRAELPFGQKGVLWAEIQAQAPPTARERLALAGLGWAGGALGILLLLPFARRPMS